MWRKSFTSNKWSILVSTDEKSFYFWMELFPIEFSEEIATIGSQMRTFNSLNPFKLNFPFLYTLKTSENKKISEVFRG